MKQQVLVIGGADAFYTYESYLKSLRAREIDLKRFVSRGWKLNLREDLGGKYEVLIPNMPNKDNARYLEWKILFEKIFPLVDENVVLVGHSMGGVFLAKYLSEKTVTKK